MNRGGTKALVESGVMIALSAVLSFIKVYRAPQGGSVTAGSMVPILFLALKWGPQVGITAGLVYGVLRYFISSPSIVHPVQFLLDYPVAFAALGLAGFFRRWPAIGAMVGIAGRLVAHVVAGMVFFAQYAPKGTSPFIYSLAYNASYLVPEIVVSAIVIYMLSKSPALNLKAR